MSAVWALYVASLVCCVSAQLQLPLNQLNLPAGFNVQLFYNRTLPSARQMAVSEADNGTYRVLYVGSSASPGNVYALVDRNSTGVATEAVTVLRGLRAPSGVAFSNGSLWVGESNRITRYDNVDSYVLQGKAFPAGTLVTDALPSDSAHSLKYLRFGPDGKLYVPLGGPFNVGVCKPYGDIAYCTINRINPDGSDLETVATGVRNSVGYDWHPESGLMVFTDNGRDDIGDDRPDDELNVMEEIGQDFGFPYCQTQGYGNPYQRSVGQASFIVDPDVPRPGANNSAQSFAICEERATLPAQPLGPHVASLGIKFYTGAMFPTQYRNSVFIALHGSWDRTPEIGHALMNAQMLPNGTVTNYTIFANGWLQQSGTRSTSWGRPVDVVQLSDGSLLVSGDSEGAIYRITYKRPVQATSASISG